MGRKEGLIVGGALSASFGPGLLMPPLFGQEVSLASMALGALMMAIGLGIALTGAKRKEEELTRGDLNIASGLIIAPIGLLLFMNHLIEHDTLTAAMAMIVIVGSSVMVAGIALIGWGALAKKRARSPRRMRFADPRPPRSV